MIKGPSFFFDGAHGAPALIQSFNGDVGNFEVVVGSRDGGLVHVWRDNDAGGLPWRAPTRFGTGLVDGVALIQGNFGEEDAGHLELIVNESGRLAHYFRDDGHSWQWSGPNYFADDVPVVGTPALVQSRHGARGNFELVAAHRDGGLVHIWRDNDSGGYPWRARTRFGRGAVGQAAVGLSRNDLEVPEILLRSDITSAWRTSTRLRRARCGAPSMSRVSWGIRICRRSSATCNLLQGSTAATSRDTDGGGCCRWEQVSPW